MDDPELCYVKPVCLEPGKGAIGKPMNDKVEPDQGILQDPLSN
jgi:hypothetical protein